MRLDGLDEIARRAFLRSLLSLGVALAIGAFALGLVWLQRDYGALAAEHARAQEALQRRDRLAAMGELSATVAHEIRNPLNAIAMSAQRLRSEYRDTLGADEDAVTLLDVIRGESQRLDQKIRQFLDYARPPQLVIRVVDLPGWLAAVVDAQRARAAAHHVDLQLGHVRSGSIAIDPDQVQQVIDNLVRNAIDASPHGGRVRVHTAEGNGEFAIIVEDEGPGVPDALKSRIFDLYFTTKPDGTGVGLAVAHQVAMAHGARIDVTDRAPGPGTVMAVRWPHVPSSPRPA
jgi:signal transduction histidine kinase